MTPLKHAKQKGRNAALFYAWQAAPGCRSITEMFDFLAFLTEFRHRFYAQLKV
jgi:hypothetical protein